MRKQLSHWRRSVLLISATVIILSLCRRALATLGAGRGRGQPPYQVIAISLESSQMLILKRSLFLILYPNSPPLNLSLNEI